MYNAEVFSGGTKCMEKAREGQEPWEEQRNKLDQDRRGI